MRDKKGTRDRLSEEDIFKRDYSKIRQIQPRASQNNDEKIRRLAQDSPRSQRKSRQKGGSVFIKISVPLLAFAIGTASGLGGGYYLWGYERPYTINLKEIEMPSWIEQDFIRKNLFSRPDVTLKRVDNIVIHYVANKGSSAAANRSYFDNLADQDPQKSGTVGGSHFIVGLEGEILQIIPLSEVTYAAAPRNFDTLSIEVCHPDDTGEFNPKTYDSLVRLTAWLCEELELSSKDLIRHHDVSGKNCPKYYVENEDAWKQFKKDVKEAMEK